MSSGDTDVDNPVHMTRGDSPEDAAAPTFVMVDSSRAGDSGAGATFEDETTSVDEGTVSAHLHELKMSCWDTWWAKYCYPQNSLTMETEDELQERLADPNGSKRNKKKLAHHLNTQNLDQAAADKLLYKTGKYGDIPKFLYPNCMFKKWWDLLIALMILQCAWVIPKRISFYENQSKASFVFDRLQDLLFTFDIILTFRTYIVDEEKHCLIMSARRIANVYLKSWFIVDVLSTVPFDVLSMVYVAASDSKLSSANTLRISKLMRAARLSKMFRVLRLGKMMKQLQHSLGIRSLSFFAMKFSVIICFAAHYLACTFHYVGAMRLLSVVCPKFTLLTGPWGTTGNTGHTMDQEHDTNILGHNHQAKPPTGLHPAEWMKCCMDSYNITKVLGDGFIDIHGADHPSVMSWLHGHDIACNTNYEKYWTSMYWAMSTMTTIGYGDVTPTNLEEKMFSIVGAVFGAVIFAYGTSSVANLVANASQHEVYYNRQTDLTAEFCKVMKLPKSLQHSISEYFFYKTQTSENFFFDTDSVLSVLSPYLRRQVEAHCYTKPLSNVRMFCQASLDTHDDAYVFVHSLVHTAIKYEVWSPLDFVFLAHQPHETLYTIVKGGIVLAREELRVDSIPIEDTSQTPQNLIVMNVKEGETYGEDAMLDFTASSASGNFFNQSVRRHLVHGRAGHFSEILSVSKQDFQDCAVACEIPLEAFERHMNRQFSEETILRRLAETDDQLTDEDRQNSPSTSPRADVRGVEMSYDSDDNASSDGAAEQGSVSSGPQVSRAARVAFASTQLGTRNSSSAASGGDYTTRGPSASDFASMMQQMQLLTASVQAMQSQLNSQQAMLGGLAKVEA